MDKNKRYKTGEIADLLDVHPNTVRSYADQYAEHLSEYATAARRRYTYDDALVLMTVVQERNKGLTPDQILEVLDQGTRVDELPDDTDDTTSDVIPVQVVSLQTKIERLGVELTRARADLDTALDDNAGLRDRVIRLERDLGEATGKLEIISAERKPSQYWLIIVAIAVLVTAVGVYVLAIT